MEEWSCDECKYYFKKEDEYPCNKCVGTAIFGTEEYNLRKLYFECKNESPCDKCKWNADCKWIDNCGAEGNNLRKLYFEEKVVEKKEFDEPCKLEQDVDNVNHPKHYEGNTSLECIETMLVAFGREATMNFCMLNAFKYLWRYKNKNGYEDVKKAEWYCEYWFKLYNEKKCCESNRIQMYGILDKIGKILLESETKVNGAS